MNVFFAFLRGINVGGHNIIKMEDLRNVFTDLGYTGVKTYIQSGNVKFETKENDVLKLKNKLEKKLKEEFNYTGCVILRSLEQLKNMSLQKVFEKYEKEEDVKLYVCFADQKVNAKVKIPLKIEKEGLEIIKIKEDDVYVVSYPIKDRYGFPNNFVEKEFGVLSTARNVTTIYKMINEK